MRQITLLTNGQIKNITAEYLKAIVFNRRDSLNFMGENVTITMKYKVGKNQYLLFRVGSVKINSLEDIVKTTMYYLEGTDKNLRFEKIYLRFLPDIKKT